MQVGDSNYQGFMLPAVMNPPDSLCFTVKVPNDQGHIAAFLGALFELTQWISWQRDPAKRGKDAAAVWRTIWTDLAAQSCSVPPAALHGMEVEEFMPLRVDCNCNVFVTCCDGTEKQILTKDQVLALLQSQPGAGSQQPAPGQTVCNHVDLQASNTYLVPIPVNSGDILTVNNLSGATNDPDYVAPLDWLCVTGGIFFAGTCSGTPPLVATDPVPTAQHLSLVVKLGATYYPLVSPFTVPAGVTNQQPVIQLNDSNLLNDSGSVSFDLCVQNNAAGTFIHTFDFTTSSNGWVVANAASGYVSTWSPGVGWVQGDGHVGAQGVRGVFIGSPMVSARTFTEIVIYLSYAGSGDGSEHQALYTNVSNWFTHVGAAAIGGSNINIPTSKTEAGDNYIEIDLVTDDLPFGSPLSGSCTVTKVIVQGVGTDPF